MKRSSRSPGRRYGHQTDRHATRWGHDEGHVIFSGRKVHHWLASINQAAAESLEEGFEETLTINRLDLSPK